MKNNIMRKFKNLMLPKDIEEHSERVYEFSLAIANEVMKEIHQLILILMH